MLMASAVFNSKKDASIDDHVSAKISNSRSSEKHRNGNFSLHPQAFCKECNLKRVAINRFKKSISKLVVNFIENSDNCFAQFRVFIARIDSHKKSVCSAFISCKLFS